jgi:peptide/nickel transport system substrate-binding protein
VVKLDGEAVQAEKLDERTVRIILPRPSDFFTGRLGKLRMSPAHLYENVAMEDVETSEQNGLGVGSGPYMVSEHKAGEYLGLARYDGYYGEAGPFAEVEYRVIAAASSQEIAFANGEINAFRIQDESGLDQYEGDAGYNVYAMPEGRVNYIQVNGNSAVLTDIAKREAVVKTLNMDELVLGAYGSDALALPARSMFHDGDLYYDPAFTGYRQDLEKARQMAADNGLDDAVVKILYNTARAGMEETATMIHQQLTEAGVNAELMGLDSAGFFQALFYPDAGSWDLGLNGYASNGNPSYSISWNTTNGSLASNSAMSEAVDALWVAADEEPDAARRQEKYNELNQAVLDCYSFVPVSCPNLVVATQSEFTGLDAFLARYYNKIV